MNKKRYIPLVAIGALILSLIVVFPAFGAGTAGFIMPGAIDDANDGSLTDDTPDTQEYGRQGGEIGLHLEDDSLNVPIRRVLIPELDASPDGVANVTAHSDMVYSSAANVGDNDHVMIGMHNVRKVMDVTVATTPTSTPVAGSEVTLDWYIPLPANQDATAFTALALPTPVLTGFAATSSTLTLAVDTPDDFPAEIVLPTASTTHTSDGEGRSEIAAPTLTLTDSLGITADEEPMDKTYTVTFTVSQAAADPVPAVTKKATVYVHLYYAAKIEVDRPFAKTESDLALYEVDKETLEGLDGVNWEDNYGLYAMAVLVSDSAATPAVDELDTYIGTTVRFRGDHVVAASNIDRKGSLGSQEHRLTGSSAGSVGRDDALVIQLSSANDALYDSDADPATDEELIGIDEIDDDNIVLEADVAGAAGRAYIAAWFEEPNDTGGTVRVRSQAFSSNTTVVMMETGADTGKFALQIEAVAFGTPTADDPATTDVDEAVMRYEMAMVNDMKDGNPLPKLPVNPRDVVTLSSSDSSATLNIETTDPSFTGLSPSHNFAGSDSRPTVSGQVTDGDSGLDEKKIDVLFRVNEGGTIKTETVNPENDADSDAISGGFEVSARLGDDDNDVVPDDDATIEWWIRAIDKAGNVGFSDRMPTNDDGTPNTCTADDSTAHADLAEMGCQPYVILLDSTSPKLLRAETGRHWNSALTTGNSKDKTEYRVTEADATSVMVVFDEHLDSTSISSNDFEVNGASPSDATLYNVTVRDDMPDRKIQDPNDASKMIDDPDTYDGNPTIVGNPQDVGEKRGYVFLRLSADLKANAEPKVELVGDVLDLAGNEQDTGTDNDALDRIAPTLTVTIDEGSRPATMDKVNLTIESNENIGSPTIEFVQVFSYDGDAMVTDDSDKNMGTAKFVSATKYTAVVSAGSVADGLYTIHVKATDAAGGNIGMTGDMTEEVDVSSDTKAVLFEHDENIGDPDINPDEPGIQKTFETDDMNGYIRIDFAAEAREYDNEMYDHDDDTATDKIRGDDLDTHHGVTIVSATLNGDDISGSLQSNDAGNVFLYRAPEGLEVGKHELAVIAMDAAGNKHAVAKKATIEITERKPFSLKLNPGWNLVSIPGEPSDPDINVVIPADRTDITSVLAYDPTVPGLWLSASRGADGMFSGTLKNITATRGYWVETNTFTSLPVMIPKQSPGQARVLPTIPVAKGWNMVPILDVDGNFKLEDGNDKRDDSEKLPILEIALKADNSNEKMASRGYLDGLDSPRVYTFNTITNRWDLVSEVQIGKGYWVYVAKAGIIVP